MEPIDILYTGHQTPHLETILDILSEEFHANLILPNAISRTADTLVIPSDGGYNVSRSSFQPHYNYPSKFKPHKSYLDYFLTYRLEFLESYPKVIGLHETAYSLWVSVLNQKVKRTESGIDIIPNNKIAYTSEDDGILFLTPSLAGLTHFSLSGFKAALDLMVKKDPPNLLGVFANIDV